ncbi:4-hydroxythreonine-4-phosphate dehydrogenase PdxA [Litorilinea aerophila]|uniref:4-hydroxythreonine-4-phosphate dehydrogenase n=1 Tax=Litorilinea aerophila TaxID=1204385 RepID=A0A540VL82_9CHLR|nr:4-hydroxythreonine-4-phosphate dehydrogenase PdxA [Litorilinea aerophila]MCC9075166.1 4-hydroxythreonine-4-phosphate dehydrogenase PdxA [Litorilinea aerophila]OUC06703.1 4-hydroxythreonine-4-phosphate dehydrogenase [Litorilinea aerophila]
MKHEREERPLLAITLGDPAGIGPEVIVKALQHPEPWERCRPLVVGDSRILRRAMAWVGGPPLAVEAVASPQEGRYASGTLTVLDLGNADPAEIEPGVVQAAAGKAAVEYVFRACDLALAGAVDGVVTAPLNKEAMHLAGFRYPGHTELLAERTGAQRVSMLLVGPKLRVVHVSTHVSLQEAIRRVTPERVREVIGLAQQACQALGIQQPRIAVAGLNPHASEGGLFGDEEARAIEPAIAQARADGLNVSDPLPPDTVFLRAVQGEFDIVVAMYHDQGHIPMKLLAFDSGVNVSIGLPIIRTSVDHGTAFDIAGTGQAREESMLAALDVAVQMARARRLGAARHAPEQ